ncbi:hypothetical protein Acin_0534 [Acidaminococcus intestini RyC-MR95]|uniref:Uncharacterized protein n=1 Tax=Acidaminococcus intestini (strain RyC-MR95) TaxID=568816 RepID=G4Q3Q1_ACIIR|nr:hypothetical protein Acin_0534 [Acidaminococcus intestini RyC-MR95]
MALDITALARCSSMGRPKNALTGKTAFHRLFYLWKAVFFFG